MTTDTIAEQVSTMHAGMATQPPNEVMGAFTREQADLAAQGIPSSVVAAGASLPDTNLLDAHGTPTTLYGVTGGARRWWCSTAAAGAPIATWPSAPTRTGCWRPWPRETWL